MASTHSLEGGDLCKLKEKSPLREAPRRRLVIANTIIIWENLHSINCLLFQPCIHFLSPSSSSHSNFHFQNLDIMNVNKKHHWENQSFTSDLNSSKSIHPLIIETRWYPKIKSKGTQMYSQRKTKPTHLFLLLTLIPLPHSSDLINLAGTKTFTRQEF